MDFEFTPEQENLKRTFRRASGPEILPGSSTFAPSPAPSEGPFTLSMTARLERVKKMSGLANPDPYTSQVYDHVNMVLMAMAVAKDTTGTAIKDSIRRIGDPEGVLRALQARPR